MKEQPILIDDVFELIGCEVIIINSDGLAETDHLTPLADLVE